MPDRPPRLTLVRQGELRDGTRLEEERPPEAFTVRAQLDARPELVPRDEDTVPERKAKLAARLEEVIRTRMGIQAMLRDLDDEDTRVREALRELLEPEEVLPATLGNIGREDGPWVSKRCVDRDALLEVFEELPVQVQALLAPRTKPAKTEPGCPTIPELERFLGKDRAGRFIKPGCRAEDVVVFVDRDGGKW